MELVITECKNKVGERNMLGSSKAKIPTLCLNMIVKNESKIITRMFDAVIDIIDCYCICDTGSTDDTVNIILDYFSKREITGKIIHEPFKNFAYNRNVALTGCKGMSDYVLLLDADMILKVSEKFDKKALVQDFYYLFQGSEMFYYQNVRIVKNTGLFSYVGVTHEYINTPPRSVGGKVFDKKVIFILDVGDGGAKSDKFKRDITLLEKGIEDEPNNTRYYFYLGNSYRDYGDHDKAIETYIKQMSMNSWDQEKYCACISVGNIYQKKGDMPNAAKYWLKTSEYDNERIEGVVKAAEYYRVSGESTLVNILYNKHKGYKRNLAEGKLFVEQDKYRDVLEYNNSISAYYVNDKESGYVCCKEILIHSIMDDNLLKSTLKNMRFYKDFLLKDSLTERENIFIKVDCLLEKMKMNKENDEVWRLLNSLRESKGSMPESKGSNLEPNINLEPLYQKIKQCRIDGKCVEAYKLYQTIDKSTDNSTHFLWELAYEYSIFAYYNGLRNINDQVVTILNNCTDESIHTSVLSNMKFYYDILHEEKVYDFTHTLKHNLDGIEYNFNSSSSCIIPYGLEGGYLLNIRLVNYYIEKKDEYVLNGKHIVSMYKAIELTKDFLPIVETLIDVDYINRRYIGVEDVRFYKEKMHDNINERILFTGTGYHADNTVGVVNGVYIRGKPLNDNDIKPAFNLNSTCEKNWVYVNYKNETHMIYYWYPLKICKVDKNNALLDLIEEKQMPGIFKYARGSSCGIEYNDEIWFVVHLVSYETRDYYHLIAVFDVDLNLKRYSAPFKYEGSIYEYCIGLAVEEDRVIIPYSTMDRTTKVAVYDKKYIESKLIYTYSYKETLHNNNNNNNTVLFFTAFKDLGRKSWGEYGRSMELYLSWFANLTTLPINLICYCDDDVGEKIKQQIGFTKTYPYDIEHTFYNKYYDREKAVFDSNYFKILTGHRTSPECRNFGYNLVNHNKYSFLKRTKEQFPNYTHYAWIDFGYCRSSPSIQSFDFTSLSNKILFSAFYTPNDKEDTTPTTLCINPKNINPFNIIQGSSFIVNNNDVEWLHDEYEKIMQEYYAATLIDQDQAHILQLYKKYPERFDLHITSEWFSLLKDRFKQQVRERDPITLNKTIHMTYKKQLPDKVLSRWKSLNPDYSIEVSLDADCIYFLKTHFNDYVADLFKTIPEGMYKADLWRLCKLYIEGGVYADVDLVPYVDLDSLDKDVTFYTCLGLGGESIFQAFMVNFSKPKSPLLLHFLISYLLNHPYKYKNGPTYDMFNCVKYNLGGREIVTEKKYDLNEIKIYVNIGASETNTKIIELHYFPSSNDFDYNIKLHQSGYQDRFNLHIIDSNLIVTRLDAAEGWGHTHSCDIVIQCKEKILLFNENIGKNNSWITCFVSYKNKKILDSRDLEYFNNKGW
jgi:hypothetical protein